MTGEEQNYLQTSHLLFRQEEMLENKACLYFSPEKHFNVHSSAREPFSPCGMKIKVPLPPAQRALEAAGAEGTVGGRWLEMVHELLCTVGTVGQTHGCWGDTLPQPSALCLAHWVVLLTASDRKDVLSPSIRLYRGDTLSSSAVLFAGNRERQSNSSASKESHP